jgi:hypothetical protein
MLKFENVATVGDIIRAYDFKPCANRDDAYLEGIVEDNNNHEMGYPAFKVMVTADKFNNGVEIRKLKRNRVGGTFFVPHQVSFMEFDFRVINLSK